jgi:hypothetical protein
MKQRSYTSAFRGLRDFIVKPQFFILAGLLYLAGATIAVLDPAMQSLNPRVSITPLTFLVFIFGLASFYFGLRTSRYAKKLGYLPLVSGILLGTIAAFFILNLNIVLALMLNLAALTISLVLLFSRLRFEYVFAIGLMLFWINFLLVGFPILNPELHVQFFSIINPMSIIGLIFMLYSMVRLYPKYRFLWILVILSTVVFTYRSYIAMAFMTFVWLELKNMKSPRTGKIFLIIAGLLILTAISLYIGYIAKVASSGSWSLGPVGTLEYRLALTMGVFDDIVKISFPFGHTFGGSITVEPTEYTCMVLYGCTSRITSTAFGIAMLDFGLLGIFLVSWFVALVLQNLYRIDFPLYALLFSSLFITLDVGINIFVVLLFIYLGWTRMVFEWRK